MAGNGSQLGTPQDAFEGDTLPRQCLHWKINVEREHTTHPDYAPALARTFRDFNLNESGFT